MMAATLSCVKAAQIKPRLSAAAVRISALAAAGRCSGSGCLPLVVLEALPGDIVRVAEAHQRRAKRITLDTAGLDAGRRQLVGQPLQFGARDAERDMVKVDAVLVELVPSGVPGSGGTSTILVPSASRSRSLPR